VAVEAVDSSADQPHRHTRYCRRFHEFPGLEDERLVEFLLAYGRQAGGRTVLFITKDKTVPIVSDHREILSEYFDFTLPPRAVVDQLMHKDRLPQFLEQAGTRYPRTADLHSGADLDAASAVVGFPCVLKPTTRAHGFKAVIAHSSAELASWYAIASQHADDWVIQELVRGHDPDVYFCYAYIGRDGRPKGVFVGHKLRQNPRGIGIAAEAAGCDDEAVRNESLRLFTLSGYRGFGSTEFRRDPETGAYFLIEFTVGRTDFNVGCAIANGVDLPYLGYADSAGLGAPGLPPMQQNRRSWVDLSRSLNGIVQERCEDRASWPSAAAAMLRSMSPANAFTLFDAGDTGPFIAWIRSRGLSLPRAIRNRMRTLNGKTA
jgi:predicted ATP-grasp superfamily ATP-dependent carboligase